MSSVSLVNKTVALTAATMYVQNLVSWDRRSTTLPSPNSSLFDLKDRVFTNFKRTRPVLKIVFCRLSGPERWNKGDSFARSDLPHQTDKSKTVSAPMT